MQLNNSLLCKQWFQTREFKRRLKFLNPRDEVGTICFRQHSCDLTNNMALPVLRAGTRSVVQGLRITPSLARFNSSKPLASAGVATPVEPVQNDLPNSLTAQSETQDVIVADTISGAPR